MAPPGFSRSRAAQEEDAPGLILPEVSEDLVGLRDTWILGGGRIHPLDRESADSWIDAAAKLARRLKSSGATGVALVLPRDVDVRSATLRLVEAGCDDVLPDRGQELRPHLEHSLAQLVRRREAARRLEAAGLTGRSPAMRRVRTELAAAVEDPDLSILLLGATGTGKYLAARALHQSDSKRRSQRFHALDCGAVADGLLGSELFGHVRGAFTGAVGSRPGALTTAGSGTLLLDEVGELRPELQAVFLTALQERCYRAVGSDHDVPIQCRIVAATNQDLPGLVSQGRFRPDLFFRLDGLRVRLPTLKERAEDIPDLFRTLVARHAMGPGPSEIDPDVFGMLGTMSFPGNIRQLETVARAAVRASAGGTIFISHLPLGSAAPDPQKEGENDRGMSGLVRQGLTLNAILSRSRLAAVTAALDLVRRGAPELPRTELVRQAAKHLQVAERTIYNTLSSRNGSPEDPGDD